MLINSIINLLSISVKQCLTQFMFGYIIFGIAQKYDDVVSVGKWYNDACINTYIYA